MNTFDPSDCIRYVSMDQPHLLSRVGTPSDVLASALPEGYANASPKTRLRRNAAGPSFQPQGPSPLQPLPASVAGDSMWLPPANGMA